MSIVHLILKVVPFPIPRVTCSMVIPCVLVLYSGSMGEPSHVSLGETLTSCFSGANVAIMASTISSSVQSQMVVILSICIWFTAMTLPSWAGYYWQSP